MNHKLLASVVFCLCLSAGAFAARLLIPMDAAGQANHLKAYGVAFAAMQQGIKVDWLLNYRGGSFGMDDSRAMEDLCKQRGVTYSTMTAGAYAGIIKEVSSPSFDGQVAQLEKAPRIAVYTPLNKEPWDDAVTLALTYAGIPFDKIYASEVLAGDLDKYDWLHLHHEDFTGQYGKFWSQFMNAEWYKNDKKTMEALAAAHGYKKVSQLQLAVVKKIRDFVGAGGNMFAMCAATETFDIALAADGVDISPEPFDGDPIDSAAQRKLNFGNCFAFTNFILYTDPFIYQHSSISNIPGIRLPENMDYFTIASPPGKMDAVPLMLCQNHTRSVSGFMGQTTAFRKGIIKPGVMILAECTLPSQADSKNGPLRIYDARNDEARYIHGEFGQGSWTFLGGHDPEAYQHRVGDPPTDLSLFPNSPGYRLILNNVLFPAAGKKAAPTVVVNAAAKTDALPAAPANAQPGSIRIYPNPANDELMIAISAGSVEQVSLVSISGKEVASYNFKASLVSVPMKNLAPGLYMVNVNGNYVGKVVKD